MCAVAVISAEGLAQSIRTETTTLQWRRFGSAKRMSLELAKKVSDACCRDFSVSSSSA